MTLVKHYYWYDFRIRNKPIYVKRISDIRKIKAGKTEAINSLVCFLNSEIHVSITQKHTSLVYYNMEKPKLSTGKML